MSTNNEKHEYSSSTDIVAARLKVAKANATVVTLGLFLIIACIYGFHLWKEANDVEYIEGNVLKVAGTASQSIGSPWKGASFAGQLIWSSLLETDATFTEIKPQLAESVTMSPDGLTCTIVMKDGLAWSDGEPLTVEDVVFSIESALLCSGTTNSLVTSLQQIQGAAEWKEIGVESWEKGGTHSLEGLSASGNTLTITLANPYSSFSMALTQFVILPKHALEQYNPSTYTDSTEEIDAFFQLPVSSGMYMTDKLHSNGDLELVHNPHYHATHSDIEQVVLYSDHQSMYIDYYTSSVTTEMVTYRNMAGFDEYLVNVLFYRYFVFNLLGGYELVPELDGDGNEVLDDNGEVVMVTSSEEGEDREENTAMQNPLLRQAISLAIDRAYIASDVYLGNATADFGLTGNDAYAQYLAGYDMNEAKALLVESGYDMERPLRIHHYHSDANSLALLATVKKSLESLGLTVIVEKTAGSDNMYQVREYDILLKGYAGQSPTEWYVEYLSTASNVSNLLGTDEFDDMILRLEGATSDEEYNKALEEMQELDRNTMYRIPIVTSNDCTYINANRIYVPEDMEFGNVRYRSDLRLDEWYVKKA